MSATTTDAIEIDVAVTFTSDWHIGTGRGRAREIDSAIVRDPLGLPYVPAKTFIGILRDAAETAAGALDQGDIGPFHQWVDYLFGSQPARKPDSGSARRERPIPAALTGGPLTLSRSFVVELLKGANDTTDASRPWDLTREDLLAACTVIRPGVQINARTGTADEDFLRFEERARGGLVVGGTWRLAVPDDGPIDLWPAALILGCAARLTDAIGGKRRRGAGRAQVTLTGKGDFDGQNETLNALFEKCAKAESVPSPPRTATRWRPSHATNVDIASLGDHLRHSHDLVIEVIAPVLVDTTLRGNTVTSAAAIPGSVLLPIVARGLGGKLGALIREGRIVVTSATVEVEEQRSWPWPQCLSVSKDAAESPQATNLIRPHTFNPRLKPKSGTFVVPSNDGTTARYEAVESTESIHAIIEDATQRPTSETGGLFVYCGISPGTKLRAEVWLPKGIGLDSSALDGRHTIGRSAKDDFGDVKISVVELGPHQGGVPHHSGIESGHPFTVWLGSDVILRNERGVPDPRPATLAAELSARLGCGPVHLVSDEADGDEAADAARMATSRRESWQTAWGLPRPSLVGICAGSVFRFAADKLIEADKLTELECTGIGERRAEGYGRISINHPLLDHEQVEVERAARVAPDRTNLYWLAPARVSEDASVAVIKKAAWRRKIAEYALTQAPHIRKEFLPSKVSNSQLGTLRQLVLQLDEGGGGFEHFMAWHDRMKALASSNRPGPWGTKELGRLDSVVRSVWTLLDPDAAKRHTPSSPPDSPADPRLVWHKLFGATDAPGELTDGPLALHALKLMLIEACRAAITEAHTAATLYATEGKGA